MPVSIEITDRQGARQAAVQEPRFWIGSIGSGCTVEIDIGTSCGRIAELERTPSGTLQIRLEAGLPFPVRSATGNVGTRFEPLLDGDVLNMGPALVRIAAQADPEEGDGDAAELDPATLMQAPGLPVGSWYETFMELADHLEGVTSPETMIQSSMQAILEATGADRAHLLLDPVHAVAGLDSFFLDREGRTAPFRVSGTMVDQVRRSGRVVHVPVAAKDPVARGFQSVRSEGISAGICLPLKGLGVTLGVLYADCVQDKATLTADDLQRVAFITRMMASALGNRNLVNSLLRREPGAERAAHWALVTDSPACLEMVERVQLYAPADYTVLLRGETGTGKEVIAKALHDLSRRKKGPFVPVNCAAIPETLMESVLFGHEKGAFTGATQSKRGHFEEAHGGTILLDEIGDMALDLQAKILRVLQDRVVTPVGSSKQVKVDVRIVAATHQDLESMVARGAFRRDLYYRLQELEIALPPLRERREDIPILAGRFLGQAADELGFAEPPPLTPPAEAALMQAAWPGNIRQLQHLLKGAALRAGGRPIGPEHLDLRAASSAEGPARPPGGPVGAGVDPAPADAVPTQGSTWKDRLEAQERAALVRTMDEAGGNLTKAAELFGVPRTTYREKLVRHGLLDRK